MNRIARMACLLALATAAASAEPPQSGFDPQRHMRVSEIKEGMQGYGLTVFHGTKIDRFDVEVISILHNFNPQHDIILVRCKGAGLEHTGSIAGMSGSPIFLTDDQGRQRMAGAFAYGWPLMKDPVGGVQPIEYMVNLPLLKDNSDPKTGLRNRAATTQAASPSAHFDWDLNQAIMLPGMTDPPKHWPFASLHSNGINPRLAGADDESNRLRPLATPLMAGGLPPRLMETWGPIFRAYGLMPLQAGGLGTAATRPTTAPDVKLEPGSVLAVPLLTGDAELTAIGTCTEVLGDRTYAFGHPFNNEGAVALPMGSGRINAVIANLTTSFKIGELADIRGTVFTDELTGLAGQVGQPPATVPMDFLVHYADGSGDRHYHFASAMHPRFTPLLSAAALSAAVTGMRDLPQYHTLDYTVDLEFANGQSVHLTNMLVNSSPEELFFELGGPMMAAADNPFERVMIKTITGRVTVTPEAREARILGVNVPRLKYRPGETVRAFVTYRPFRAEEAVLPVELELPAILPEGKYVLAISDWEAYLEHEQQAKPFRFKAESIADVFAALKDITSIKHNALYVRLARQPDGVAIGRTAMSHLPSSRRQVLLTSGRSNTTSFISSTVKSVPMNYVMKGAAQFAITIDNEAHVETGSPKPPKPETPAGAPSPKADDSRKPDDTKPKTAPKNETTQPAD